MKMEMPSHFETFGVPCFFVTSIIAEDAGCGNVRVWNCAEHHGVLVPVNEVIVPAIRLMVITRTAQAAAQEAYNAEMIAGAARH
jgi:hypothetical protein